MGKSAQAVSINQKLDNIRGHIDAIYEDILKNEGFVTAEKVTFHTARHTFGTMFLTEEILLESLSKMMGHKKYPLLRFMLKLPVRESERIWTR